MHQHSINDILDRIETIKKRNEIKDDTPVRFSFGLAPSHVSSWRGSYDLPCIVFSKDAYSMSLSDFVKSLTEAISGEVFTGWKGGEFTYDGNERLFVTSYEGYSGECGISDVFFDGYGIVLQDSRYEY